MNATYRKAKRMGMFNDLICPQEACGATMKIRPKDITYGIDEVLYDCPTCGIQDRTSNEVMEDYIRDRQGD